MVRKDMQKPRKVSNICTIYTYKSVSFPTENDPGNTGKHYFFVVISSLLVEIGILRIYGINVTHILFLNVPALETHKP